MTDLFTDYRMTVDRSTLEVWQACPMQARLLMELKKHIVGNIAVGGEEGHQAISRTITRCLPGWEEIAPREFTSMLQAELRASRPDVQPDVIEAFQSVSWKIGAMLAEHTAAHVLRYDGGEGERSGQLAWECGDFLVTSELDLLLASQSKAVLREHDWKSGWKFHDIDSVRDSLQFQLHAVLVFNNYPECDELDIAVWNTRKGSRLQYVTFPRARLSQYEARIRSYLNVLADYETVPLEQVPCWASTEKCRICDVAARCPAVDQPLPADDGELLRKIIASERHVEALHDEAKARATKAGGSLKTPHGTYELAGAENPRMTWKLKPSTPTE